jgi:hypothetical protein
MREVSSGGAGPITSGGKDPTVTRSARDSVRVAKKRWLGAEPPDADLPSAACLRRHPQ